MLAKLHCTAPTYLLAHHEHIGAPQVLVGRLAVESILEERRHSSRHSVAVKIVRFRLHVRFGTEKQTQIKYNRMLQGIELVLGGCFVGVRGILSVERLE